VERLSPSTRKIHEQAWAAIDLSSADHTGGLRLLWHKKVAAKSAISKFCFL
jgi:hypothetical protein